MQTSTRAIFLDFDGVIRIAHKTARGVKATFCEDRIRLIESLALKCEAKVVISSDWREGHSRDEIYTMLSCGLSETTIHEDWATPVLRMPKSEVIIPRGVEILTWLYRNPIVTEFVIIDDLGVENFPLMSANLIECDQSEGFTKEKFEVAVSLFV